MMDWIKLDVTTDASGDGTATATVRSCAKLYAVEWVKDGFDDGVDATLSVTSANSGNSVDLLTLTNANSSAYYYPRAAAHDEAGAGATFDGTNEIYVCPVVVGTLTLTIAEGGNAKSGSMVVYLA